MLSVSLQVEKESVFSKEDCLDFEEICNLTLKLNVGIPFVALLFQSSGDSESSKNECIVTVKSHIN